MQEGLWVPYAVKGASEECAVLLLVNDLVVSSLEGCVGRGWVDASKLRQGENEAQLMLVEGGGEEGGEEGGPEESEGGEAGRSVHVTIRVA